MFIEDIYENKYFIEKMENDAVYDDNGCLIVNLIIYGIMAKFGDFWNKLLDYLNEEDYPFEKVTDIKNIKTGLAESRHAYVGLDRQGERVSFHIYAVHMKEKAEEGSITDA